MLILLRLLLLANLVSLNVNMDMDGDADMRSMSDQFWHVLYKKHRIITVDN